MYLLIVFIIFIIDVSSYRKDCPEILKEIRESIRPLKIRFQYGVKPKVLPEYVYNLYF